MLPDIADYFSVTIDDLFKSNMTAYRNKAERLMAKYESDIYNSEVFELADREYRKLFSANSTNGMAAYDLGNFAYLNDLRSRSYLELAEAYYQQAIEQGREHKDLSYYKNQRQYILFLSRLGRDNESINHHTCLLEQEPNNPMNYSSLVAAYKYAGDHENAIKIAEKGLSIFPQDEILLIYAGDTYKQLNERDKAIECWNKAFEINPETIDSRFSMAFYLMDLGEYEKAREVLIQIIEWNDKGGYHIENKWVRAELSKLEEMV